MSDQLLFVGLAFLVGMYAGVLAVEAWINYFGYDYVDEDVDEAYSYEENDDDE